MISSSIHCWGIPCLQSYVIAMSKSDIQQAEDIL